MKAFITPSLQILAAVLAVVAVVNATRLAGGPGLTLDSTLVYVVLPLLGGVAAVYFSARFRPFADLRRMVDGLLSQGKLEKASVMIKTWGDNQ